MDHLSSVLEYWAQIKLQSKQGLRHFEEPEPYLFEVDEGLVEYLCHSYYEDQQSLFIGTCEGKSYCIEVLNCDSYYQLQKYIQAFNSKKQLCELVSHCNRSYQTSVLNNFVFVIITPEMQSVSLEYWNNYYRNEEIPRSIREKVRISIDSIIWYTISLLKQIDNVHRNGLSIGCISPEYLTMVLEDSMPETITKLRDIPLKLAIDLLNPSKLDQPVPDPELFPPFVRDKQSVDFYGLGLCLYSILSRKVSADFPKFGNMSRQHISKEVEEIGYVPGISELIVKCLSNDCLSINSEDLFFSKTMMTWKYLIVSGRDSNPQMWGQEHTSLLGLLSGFFFEEKSVVHRAIELLSHWEIKKILKDGKRQLEIVRIVIKEMSEYSERSQEIQVFMLEFMIEAIQAYPSLKGDPVTNQFLSTLDQFDIDYDNIQTLISDFIIKTCVNNTLTALWIVNRSYLLIDLIRNHSCEQLISLIPLIGSRAIITLKEFRNFSIIDKCITAVYHHKQIPLHFRRKFANEQIETLTSYLRAAACENLRVENIQLFIYVLEITYQMFIGAPLEYMNNLKGICSHSEDTNCMPAFADCACGEVLCFCCAREHSLRGHAISFNYYFTENYCTCDLDHQNSFTEIRPALHGEVNMVSDNGSLKNNVFCMEEPYTTAVLQTSQCFDEAVYLEIFVNNAGVPEDVSLGLADDKGNCWAYYQGRTGKILHNGREVATVPRIGTKDRAGVGITNDNIVYFTYNGYNLCVNLLETEQKHVKPVVYIKGTGTKLKVKFTDVLFGDTELFRVREEVQENLKAQIKIWTDKLVRKKLKQPDAAQLVLELAEILDKLHGFVNLNFSSTKIKKHKNYNSVKVRNKSDCAIF